MNSLIRLSHTHLYISGALALALALGGCTPGPEYERPKTQADRLQKFNEETKETKADKGMSHWWETIGDPAIHRDVALLLRDNLDLKQARARIEQAREQVKINAGMFAPMISVGASRNRNFRPAEDFGTIFGTGSFSGGGGDVRIYDTSIEGTLSATWQLDLFGQTRTRVAASEARFAAAEMDREALLHTLIAELVKNRIALASLSEQLELARHIASNRQDVLDLVERRYETGTRNVSVSDVHLARQSLASVRSNIPDLEQAIKQRTYAIDVLLGQLPGTTRNDMDDIALIPPEREIPAGIPAHLLDRRPDLRSSELRLMAEYRDVGVAISDLFPSLSLSGNIGLEDETVTDIFRSERMVGSLISQVSATLFEGGALRARIRYEEAQKEEMIAAYTKDVLTALQEVETALVRERKIGQRLHEIDREVKSAKRRVQSNRQRYERGIIPLTTYLDSELDLYDARLGQIAGRQARWDARIDLYLALGGDWVKELPEFDIPNYSTAGASDRTPKSQGEET